MTVNNIVFWGLCVTLIFLPLSFGSVEEGAIYFFEASTFLLFVLYVIGSRSSSEKNEKGEGSQGPKIPLYLKIPLVIFLAIVIFQLIPLPQSLLKIISPRSFEIYKGVYSEGLIGREGGENWWRALSFSSNLSLFELLKYIFYFLFGYLVFKCVRTKKETEIFILVMLLSALFQSFYGLAETLGGTERILGFEKKWYIGSATGTFINRNHFSGFLEMIFPISVGYLLAKANFFAVERKLSFREKIVWFGQERLQRSLAFGLIAILIGIGIFFSRSRTGIFVFFITIFLLIVAISAGAGKERERLSRKKRFRKIVRTLLLAILSLVVLIGIKPIIERFSWDELAKEVRPIIFKNTMDLIKSFPLVGTGTGTYVSAYAMFEKVYIRAITDHAHNDYLELMADCGVIGGSALILFAFGALAYLFLRWLKRSDYFVKGIVLGCLLGIAAILVHSLTDFNLRIPSNAVYFITLYALAWRTVRSGHNRNRETERRGTTKIRRIGGAVIALALMALATKAYLGYHYFYRYRDARTLAKSIEKSFPELGRDLKKAVHFSKNPLFYEQMARLYYEMALAENKFGKEEKRDSYLDQARESLVQLIKRNPIDAFAYYEMGKVYLLYNFPLLTYVDKGKLFFLKALELRPADEFLNLNILYIYLTQWDFLNEGEKSFVFKRLGSMWKNNENFILQLRNRWKENFGDFEKMKEILSSNEDFWLRIKKHFS